LFPVILLPMITLVVATDLPEDNVGKFANHLAEISRELRIALKTLDFANPSPEILLRPL